MKTGSSRPFRRPALIVVALFAALALVALAGCADSSPVAAPTSTLPEQVPSDAATAEVDIPEYETELDLTAEEEEAVDGALEAFEGYIATINRVFSSGGKDTKNIDAFASEKSLRALQESADDLTRENKYMAGEYDFYDVRIHEVNTASDSSQSESVAILFCSHDSERAVIEVGKSMPSQTEQSLTILQTATKHDDRWKISNQELWSKRCE
jgi:hypothetical protein